MKVNPVKAIEKQGILLVYPINNKPEPKSLWSELYPRSPMRWEWDSGGDNRVANLWYLRTELSCSRKVVYAKWYKGRATFFSREVFEVFYSQLADEGYLSIDAKRILEILRSDSPLSTKQLKKRVKEEWGFEEKIYNRALKELWNRLFIVGFGEVDDGAFPSLAVGATELMFEELTKRKKNEKDEKKIQSLLSEKNPFLLEFLKIQRSELKLKAETKKNAKVIRGKDLQLS